MDRKRYIGNILSWIGTKEGDSNHKALLARYNMQLKKPRGYELKVSEAWCAGGASALMLLYGMHHPTECSVSKLYELAKKEGRLTKEPLMGDLVYYDWKNDGSLNHVGIYLGKNHCNQLYVLECNYNDGIGIRTINANSKEIAGYSRVGE